MIYEINDIFSFFEETLCAKNDTDLARYDFDIPEQILLIFGRMLLIE